jgi:RNA polymerase sigma-70 factor (ECF subfamily)
MAEVPSPSPTSGTRASLLVRIRDPGDKEAWRQFVALYAPLIHRLARQRGMQDADAADLTQEVLRAVTAAAPGLDYDPKRGSFRGWLYRVTCNKIHDVRHSRQSRERGTGDSAMQRLLTEQPADQGEAERWEQEYQRHVFALAADAVRDGFEPVTWQAFWLVAVDGKSGEDAAKMLNLSVGAVYVAKSRVLARLKTQVQQLEAESEP